MADRQTGTTSMPRASQEINSMEDFDPNAAITESGNILSPTPSCVIPERTKQDGVEHQTELLQTFGDTAGSMENLGSGTPGF